MKNILKKNQLAILVIALMLVTAGYLNYISNQEALQTGTNTVDGGEQYAAIGDATLVNSGELLEEKDKQNILNTIENAQASTNTSTNTIENTVETSSIQTNTEIKNNDDYFTSSKLQREKMYSQMLETYQKILENNSISQEQKGRNNDSRKLNFYKRV